MRKLSIFILSMSFLFLPSFSPAKAADVGLDLENYSWESIHDKAYEIKPNVEHHSSMNSSYQNPTYYKVKFKESARNAVFYLGGSPFAYEMYVYDKNFLSLNTGSPFDGVEVRYPDLDEWYYIEVRLPKGHSYGAKYSVNVRY